MATATLQDRRLGAWQAFLTAHAALVTGLEKALAEEDLPPLSWYGILSALDRVGEEGARHRDLGCDSTISRSGMTRLLDRIEAAGLLERRACSTDRRGTWVHITPAGREMLERMRPVYERELDACFAGDFTEEEVETLSRLLARVAEAG